MTDDKLGKLEPLDPRHVWRTEREFSAWLAKHIEVLNDALGIEVELPEEEVEVGEFKVDLFGKVVGSGEGVVIENQLEATNHDHLGKLLTYAAGRDAKIAVWVSPTFRDEHRDAIDWLNRRSTEDTFFFGVQLEVYSIGDSLPAPYLKPVAQPSEWQKELAPRGERSLSHLQLAYHDFFADFVVRLKARSPGFTRIRRVRYDSWIHFASGRLGYAYSVSFTTGNRFRVELQVAPGDHRKNRAAFDQLFKHKEAIEAAFGQRFIWNLVEHRKAQRIYIDDEGSIDSPPERIEQMKEWGIEELLKFRDEFGPRVRAIRL